ncbi:MAG TPA: hypothetical protein VFO06_05270 [Gemmatimonadales bacterium]|nr:hypothetical protein [Gemmatimonadales bacterium]
MIGSPRHVPFPQPVATLALLVITACTTEPTGSVIVGPLAVDARLPAWSVALPSDVVITEVAVQVLEPATLAVRATALVPFDRAKDTLVVAIPVELRQSVETLLVNIGYFGSTGAPVFQGSGPVEVTAGIPAQPAKIPVTYVGPGQEVRSIGITPRQVGAAFSETVLFDVLGSDSIFTPVPTFYVGWETSSADVPIDAYGRLTAPARPLLAKIRAHTPTAIGLVRDSTELYVDVDGFGLLPTSVSVQVARSTQLRLFDRNRGGISLTVNGVLDGTPQFGFVSVDGDVLYVAPSVVPFPETFPVCATSVVAPSSTACTQVTVTP